MVKTSHAAASVTAVSPAPISDPGTLTVVVLNANSQPVAGAHVSIEPSGASGITDSTGQVQLPLGSALKYDVTASADNKTVTVPYYVTSNGATRLVVNPSYVESVEAQLHPSPWTNPQLLWTVGIALAVVIIIVVWKLLRRK